MLGQLHRPPRPTPPLKPLESSTRSPAFKLHQTRRRLAKPSQKAMGIGTASPPLQTVAWQASWPRGRAGTLTQLPDAPQAKATTWSLTVNSSKHAAVRPHHASHFASQRPDVSGVHSQRIQHMTEVQAGGLDLQLHRTSSPGSPSDRRPKCKLSSVRSAAVANRKLPSLARDKLSPWQLHTSRGASRLGPRKATSIAPDPERVSASSNGSSSSAATLPGRPSQHSGTSVPGAPRRPPCPGPTTLDWAGDVQRCGS